MSLSLTQISSPFSFLLFPITLYHYEQLLEFFFHQLLEVSNSLVPFPGINVQSQCSVLGYWRKSLKSFRFGPLKLMASFTVVLSTLLFSYFLPFIISSLHCPWKSWVKSIPPSWNFLSTLFKLPVLATPNRYPLTNDWKNRDWGGNFLKHFSLLYKLLYSYPSLLSPLPYWEKWCSSWMRPVTLQCVYFPSMTPPLEFHSIN